MRQDAPSVMVDVSTIAVHRGQTITVNLNPNQAYRDGSERWQNVELRVLADGTVQVFLDTARVQVRDWERDGWHPADMAPETAVTL